MEENRGVINFCFKFEKMEDKMKILLLEIFKI